MYFEIKTYQTGTCFIDEGYTTDRSTIKNVPVDVDSKMDIFNNLSNLPKVTIYPTPGNGHINSEYFMKIFPRGIDCFADIDNSKAYLKQINIWSTIFVIILLIIFAALSSFIFVVITIVLIEDMNNNQRMSIIVYLCMVVIIISSTLLQININRVNMIKLI